MSRHTFMRGCSCERPPKDSRQERPSTGSSMWTVCIAIFSASKSCRKRPWMSEMTSLVEVEC